jgi:hypothetical protein
MLPLDEAEDSAEQLSWNKRHDQPQHDDQTRSNEENFEVIDQPQRDDFTEFLESIEGAHDEADSNRDFISFYVIDPRVDCGTQPFLEGEEHRAEEKRP